ncbi:MAG: hypothetical protein LBD40_04100 [Puniceicoccales bacterium]|nr:hypothetical protein [Puniceicoccales bacterium]
MYPETKTLAGSEYQGIQRIHVHSEIPKGNKRQPLIQEDKKMNRKLFQVRVFVENVVAFMKRFKIIADTHRNR